MGWKTRFLLMGAAALAQATPARAEEIPAPPPAAMPTVTIFTDGLADPNSRTAQIARELAIGVDRSKTLRAMPVMGYGGERGVRELLQQRGDFSMVNSDIFAFLGLINAHHDVRQKVALVTGLFSQRIFLLARGGIASLAGLAGKKVAITGPEATTGITAQTVFGLSRIPAAFTWIEDESPIEADGALVLEGDAQRYFPRLLAGGFRLVPLMPEGALARVYRPAVISAADAPGLTDRPSVATLRLETVLAVSDIAPGHPRHGDVTRFIDGFFGLLPRLHKRFPGSIWNRLDADAPVPGWRRYAYAAQAKPAAPVGQEVQPAERATEAVAAAGRTGPPLRLAVAPQPPLADPKLAEGGVIADLAAAVLKDAAGGQALPLAASWTADRQGLIETVFAGTESGFAGLWETPACGETRPAGPDAATLCEGALLSDALFELPYVLLVRSGSDFTLDAGRAGEGVLCAPADRDLPALAEPQRQWIGKKLGLVRAPTLVDCASMLERGEVDGVLASEIEGGFILARRDAGPALRARPAPLATRGIHLALPKRQPGAQAMLAGINAAIARLKSSGRHGEIVARHTAELQGGAGRAK